MSTYQDTNPISPDALVLGYQVRDHHLPNRPPLARTDTYAQALRAVEQLHQAYRRSLAANGEGTAGLSQSLLVLAVTAGGSGDDERTDPVGPPTEGDPPANDQHGGGNAGCDGLEQEQRGLADAAAAGRAVEARVVDVHVGVHHL